MAWATYCEKSRLNGMALVKRRERLLFLAHRIPYPPNKGDKIRSYNMLKYFSQMYEVYLGAFIDNPKDQQYVDTVKTYCADVCLLDIHPLFRRFASLTGFITGHALTLPYYSSSKMQHWVDDVIANHNIDAVVVFSSPMAQFVEHHRQKEMRVVVDFVDVDSDKWRQYAHSKAWPLNWVYRREALQLLKYERRIALEFDATVLISEEEAALFKQLAPETENTVYSIQNGVDTDYFSPRHHYPNPYGDGRPVLVFTGAMDYWANVDAVCWFAESIFPVIRSRVHDAKFYIVGSNPTNDVLALEKYEGIIVTGAVNDIRPYLAHAKVAVAPMRIARGVQNKVLEAMSMEKIVLATPEAAEGILAEDGVDLIISADESKLAQLAIELLNTVSSTIETAARAKVLRHYGWERHLSQFNALLCKNELDSNRLVNRAGASV